MGERGRAIGVDMVPEMLSSDPSPNPSPNPSPSPKPDPDPNPSPHPHPHQVPNVFIGGVHLGGNDDTQSAAASGKLQEMLGLK